MAQIESEELIAFFNKECSNNVYYELPKIIDRIKRFAKGTDEYNDSELYNTDETDAEHSELFHGEHSQGVCEAMPQLSIYGEDYN